MKYMINEHSSVHRGKVDKGAEGPRSDSIDPQPELGLEDWIWTCKTLRGGITDKVGNMNKKIK